MNALGLGTRKPRWPTYRTPDPVLQHCTTWQRLVKVEC